MTTMLVTRPEPDAQSTLLRLDALGIKAIAAPVMTRLTLDASLPPPDGFAAMAVSSANGLRALDDRGVLERYLHLPTFAVGDRTAWEARQLGCADVVSAGGTVSELVNAIARAHLSGPVFYPAGKHLSHDLGKALAPFGIMVATARIYDMVATDALPPTVIAGLAGGSIGGAMLYSRRSAEIFVALLDGHLDQGERSAIAMLCLSETVAEPLIAAHFTRIHLADWPSEEAMMALALAFTREQTAP
jgi:uroporphyrinogen-III synthase